MFARWEFDDMIRRIASDVEPVDVLINNAVASLYIGAVIDVAAIKLPVLDERDRVGLRRRTRLRRDGVASQQ
jgi:fluoride ion exporter CrcB/FEX